MSRRSGSWPQIRPVLIALHLLSIVILSLPGKGLANKKAWSTPNAMAELTAWTKRLEAIGISTTPERLRAQVYGANVAVGTWRDRIGWPLSRYARLTGATQGWAMFARPQKYPAELHIDVLEQGQWRPLVRPWNQTEWRQHQRTHNRVRKMLGRYARTFYADRYQGAARWFATEAARDFPNVTEIRVQLWRSRSPTPEQARAGEAPEGHYEYELRFDAEELR